MRSFSLLLIFRIGHRGPQDEKRSGPTAQHGSETMETTAGLLSELRGEISHLQLACSDFYLFTHKLVISDTNQIASLKKIKTERKSRNWQTQQSNS